MPPPTESAHPRTQIRSDRVLNRPGLLSAPIHTAGYPLAKGEEGGRGKQGGIIACKPVLYVRIRISIFWAFKIRICPYLYGSGPFHYKAKKSKKTNEGRLILCCRLSKPSVVDPQWFQCGSGSSFRYKTRKLLHY